MRGGGCDNDGSTNEGGTERAWNRRLEIGSCLGSTKSVEMLQGEVNSL